MVNQFDALVSYLGAHSDSDKPRSKVGVILSLLRDLLTLPWLHFLDYALEPGKVIFNSLLYMRRVALANNNWHVLFRLLCMLCVNRLLCSVCFEYVTGFLYVAV